MCTASQSQPCKCISGYTPANPGEWYVGIWSGGCKLEKALNCSERVKFEEHDDFKMPDLLNFKVNSSMSLMECEVGCLRNCSCTAYANSNSSGHEHGCILWFGDLVDAKELQCTAKQTPFFNKQKIVVIVAPIVAAIFLLSVVSILFWKKMSRREGIEQFGQGRR